MRLLTIALLAFATVAAAQKPAITANGIVNGASYALVGLPNASIAQGSIFVLFGDNMGPSQLIKVETVPLPSTQGLAGTSVNIAASGQNYAAIMLYTSRTQVAAVLPSAVPVGIARVSVTYNGQTSEPLPIGVVDRSFGAFALNQAGSGPGVMQNYIDEATRPLNTIAESAQPGQVVTLWGTGLGKVSFDETQLPVPSDMSQGVEVWVGGQSAAVQYAGRSSCCSGIDQVNFVVPQGLNACYVPVAVKIGNVVSNYVSMSVAANRGTCSDRLTFQGVDTSQLQTTGLRAGFIQLTRTSLTAQGVTTNLDAASADFSQLDFSSLVQAHGASGGVSQLGSCVVFSYKGNNPGFTDVLPIVGLDAGSQLTLTTPSGAKTLAPVTGQKGSYSIPSSGGSPATFLEPGAFTISGPGGADVGSFSASITVPQTFTPNLGAISAISRSAGFTVTWTGGQSDDLAYVIGFSQITSPQVAGAGFFCLGSISDGSLTVPPAVLLGLPASSGTSNGISASELSGPVTLKPNGLDVAQVTYRSSILKASVTFQ